MIELILVFFTGSGCGFEGGFVFFEEGVSWEISGCGWFREKSGLSNVLGFYFVSGFVIN